MASVDSIDLYDHLPGQDFCPEYSVDMILFPNSYDLTSHAFAF